MRLLVAIEVACTVVLLILTVLVSRSFARVLDQGCTLHSDHLLIAEVNLLTPRYNQGGNSGEPARAALWMALWLALEPPRECRLQRLPTICLSLAKLISRAFTARITPFPKALCQTQTSATLRPTTSPR